jgi:hypothetical protein
VLSRATPRDRSLPPKKASRNTQRACPSPISRGLCLLGLCLDTPVLLCTDSLVLACFAVEVVSSWTPPGGPVTARSAAGASSPALAVSHSLDSPLLTTIRDVMRRSFPFNFQLPNRGLYRSQFQAGRHQHRHETVVLPLASGTSRAAEPIINPWQPYVPCPHIPQY